MTILIQNASVFRPDGAFEQRDIAISGECFTDSAQDGEVFDATGCYAIPGLIDVHLHGCVGHDFLDADEAGLTKMARYQAKNGVTAICATMMTFPEAKLAAACKQIAAHKQAEAAAFVGIHLEGPFLSPDKLGAQNPAYLQMPDVNLVHRLQKAAGGLIKLIALSPELAGASELLDAISADICCSLGHTTTDYATAQKAFNRGARQVTHLYNAMPPLHHRDPGLIGAAVDAPNCRAELICDNVHVHPAVVRATMRMFGDDRLIFISDSMMATGLSDGIYELGGLAVEVRGKLSTLAGSDTIAGSATNLMDCLRTAVLEMEIPLGSAVKCASVNPAKAIGIYEQRGSIEAGKVADLLLLNEDLSIRNVFLRGKMLYA